VFLHPLRYVCCIVILSCCVLKFVKNTENTFVVAFAVTVLQKATALTGLSGVIATVSRIITALVARTHVDVTLKRIACALGSTLNTLFGHIAGSGHSGSASRVTEVVSSN
jgi:hypothetical protein